MNIQLQNKWLTQYNEIYRAIAKLQDDFEDCENVFENVLASLEHSTVLELCLDDAIDDLISDIACDIEDGIPHTYTFKEDTVIYASISSMFPAVRPITFHQGRIVTLSLHNYAGQTNVGVSITDNESGVRYYVAPKSLGDLIQ